MWSRQTINIRLLIFIRDLQGHTTQIEVRHTHQESRWGTYALPKLHLIGRTLHWLNVRVYTTIMLVLSFLWKWSRWNVHYTYHMDSCSPQTKRLVVRKNFTLMNKINSVSKTWVRLGAIGGSIQPCRHTAQLHDKKCNQGYHASRGSVWKHTKTLQNGSFWMCSLYGHEQGSTRWKFGLSCSAGCILGHQK